MDSNEDDISKWIHEIDTRRATNQVPLKGTWLSRQWTDIKDDVDWKWNHYIGSPIRSFKAGVGNLIKYRKLIWRDRWWDYAFLMEMIEFKLRDMEEHWGRDTHYVNDLDEKETMKKMLEDLEWLNNGDNEFTEGYEDEYKKRSKRFFGRFDRNHRKLWD